jgi:ATP-dependent Clp protease ATP-binding subunit ClpA
MLERFTEQARTAVVTVAQQQARHVPSSRDGGKPAVTVAHLLLALADEQTGPAAELLHAHGITGTAVRERIRADQKSGLDAAALATLGIDLTAVRDAVEASFGPGALDIGGSACGRIPFGANAKRVLALAVRATGDVRRNRIGTEHVLYGVLRAHDEATGEILAALHVNAGKLTDEVTALDGPAAA